MPRRSRPTWRELALPAIGTVVTMWVLVTRGLLAAVFMAVVAFIVVKVDDAVDDRQDGTGDDAQ